MTGTHHAPDGTFRNPWPGGAAHGPADMLRWNRERRQQVLAPTPPRGSFPTATPEILRPRGRPGDFTATWVGHASTLIQVGGFNVITDPVFCERAFPVQWVGPRRVMPPGIALHELPPIDVVLLSHNHYDHLDRHAVKWIARKNPAAVWIVPLRMGRYIHRWGAKEIIGLDWWESTWVAGHLKVTSTPARHFSARTPWDRNKSLWSGFAFEVGGKRIWFAGDTAYHPEFTRIGEACGPFDFVMIPIGAYEPRWFMRIVHVNPEEAVQIYRDVTSPHPESKPVMLGIHWGTFRLTDEPMAEPPRRAIECWQAAGLPEDRLWVAKFGESRRLSA